MSVNIGLRPATAADGDFCFDLHRAAMGRYIEEIWGWDEDTQREFHERAFDPAHVKIITIDGVDAGFLRVDYQQDEIYLGRIELHPDYQGRGIGTQLVRALLAEAVDRNQDVVLDVLVVNHRAHALYERLGFREVGRHSEGNIKIRMRSAVTARPGPSRT